MDNRVIAEKYEIIDTLFSNEFQAIFLAKKAGDDSAKYIINEFRDTDTIYSMKDNFSKEKCGYIKNIVETFYENFCFYVICNICSGPTFEAFLSENSLRLTEKMYITESLLTQLIDMEKLSPFIVYSLLDADNLAITGRRNICFNCNMKLTEENINAARTDVTRRVGEIICDIFSNAAGSDLTKAKDVLPPALLPIVQNCLEGKYNSVADLYKDFRSLLLHSVFLGSSSVDSQIRMNYRKAEMKRRLTPLRRLAAIIVILLLAGGVWTLVRNMETGRITLQNTKPTAQFTASMTQVYEGETVVFTSEASDPDAGDSIKSYLWVISKDDSPVFNSTDRDISYTFTTAGEYGVHLVVTDSRGAASEPFKAYITVLAKPVLPTPEPEPGEKDK